MTTDSTPDPIEDIEMKQALASLSILMAEYVNRLVEQGFARDEAIRISIEWHRTVAHAPADGS